MRAYSLLEIKSIDEDERIIEGIASTPEPDRIGDIVEPKGAEFKLPIPLLWQHFRDQPIGEVFAAKVTASGITIKARIAKIDEPGKLKDRLDEAWQSLKHRLVRGLSIGFKPIESARIEGTYAMRFMKWLWLELSTVTIPMHQDANIAVIRSMEAPYVAASGEGLGEIVRSSAGVPAKVVTVSRQSQTGIMKPLADQIKQFEATRAAKVADRDAIQTKASEEGRTKTVEEREKFTALSEEIEAIDQELADLRKMEASERTKAAPITGGTPDDAARSRAPHSPVITVRQTLPPGIAFTRAVMCKAMSFILMQKGEFRSSVDIAKERYPDHDLLHLYLKTAVGSATAIDATTMGPAVYAQNLESEFIEFLRPMTILGKFGTNGLPSLRRVPFNIRVIGATSGGTGYWVGEGKPKPLTAIDLEATSLAWAKVAAISVISQELARFSSPSAELMVRDSLAGALKERTDIDFIDPGKAASANVSPASITNGLTALTSSGTDADAIRADLQALLKTYIEENVDPTTLVLIMPNTLALVLSLMRNTLGNKEFPDITVNGGVLEGIPVIASQYAARPTYGNLVVAVNASDIFLSDDGDVSVDASREASLEMSDAPTQDGTTGSGASLVSLWQNNLLGLRAERFINWKKRRAAAVAYMRHVNWGSIGSPS